MDEKPVREPVQVACDYCGRPAQLVKGDAIYPHRPDLYKLKFWQCKPCDAYVGCHKRNPRMQLLGVEPLGRLANAELRAAKKAAHAAFDQLWKDEHMSRTAAYAWLSRTLNIEPSKCHIGMMDIADCNRVVGACVLWLVQKKELA